MRFDDPGPSKRVTKPPNYFSRRMQWQLLLLVFSLMLVLVLIERARDPKMYAWMWSKHPAEQTTYVIDVERKSRGDRAARSTLDSPITSGRSSTNGPAADVWNVAVQDARQFVLQSLSPSDLQTLSQSLLLVRQQKQLEPQAGGDLALILDAMDSAWQQYLANAREELPATDVSGEGDEPPSADWFAVLDRLESYWSDTLQPALREIATGQPLDHNATELSELQAAIDAILLARVEDNTFFKPSEEAIWFRLFEKLQSDPAEAPTAVSYLQLARQPAAYRGQLVRVRGAVREARWRPAPKNALGIQKYAVMTLKPLHTNAPIIVYCLDVPQGFPELTDAAFQELPRKMDVPVTIDGYFFKRKAYRSVGGVDSAPLVLAAAPRLPGATRVSMTADAAMNPTLLFVAAGVLALTLAAIIYVLTPKFRRAPIPDRFETK